MRWFILISLILCLMGCAYTAQIVKYSIIEPKPILSNLHFNDNYIDIEFSINYKDISFKLINLYSNSIKINWDNISYIDTNNISTRVIHQGIKLINKETPQAPTLIGKGNMIKDLIQPVDNIYYDNARWNYLPLIDPYKAKKEELINQKISLFFPIEIDGKNKEYNFKFNIDDVTNEQRVLKVELVP